jgi:hypothetical protein
MTPDLIGVDDSIIVTHSRIAAMDFCLAFGRTALARADDSYQAARASKEESCERQFT